MNRIAAKTPVKSARNWHNQFLVMLPTIVLQVRLAFRNLGIEAQEEAVEEVVCNVCCALARLAELNKLDLAYPTVLARFGIAKVRVGRKVGCTMNCKDVLSEYCQRRKGVVVERLDLHKKEIGGWLEAVVEDRRTPIPEQVAFRCDFPAWLGLLPNRGRHIAEALAEGLRPWGRHGMRPSSSRRTIPRKDAADVFGVLLD
jgi:hypothetical protein